LLDVHEAARVRIALDELFRFRIVRLRAFANLTIAMSVTFWWIGCHNVYLLSFDSMFCLKPNCLTSSHTFGSSALSHVIDQHEEDASDREALTFRMGIEQRGQ
jgi:hypothetical protein